MVSPSKRKRTDKKGREIEAVAPRTATNQTDSKKPVRTSRKPLASKKVYLDIRNGSALTKLEKDLKDLGASVEPFLDRDIDYVVTDRAKSVNGASGGGGLPSPSCTLTPQTPLSVSPLPSPSSASLYSPALQLQPGGAASAAAAAATRRQHLTRSRAEAMLDSVRAHPTHKALTVDPLDNAKAFNLPIYHLLQFVRWIERLLEKSRGGTGTTAGGGRRVKHLGGEFVKLECAGRRPEFRELKAWPQLRYDPTSGGGGCPFDAVRTRNTHTTAPAPALAAATAAAARGGNDSVLRSSNRRDRMTRKESVSGAGGGGGVGGYCEMCCLDYGDLSQHVASASHIKLAADPSHFAALDTYIRDACLDTFITTNGDCGGGGGALNNRRVLRSNRPSLLASAAVADSNGQTAASATAMGNRGSNTNSSSSSNAHAHNTPSPCSPCSVTATATATATVNGHVTRSTTANHRGAAGAGGGPVAATASALKTSTEQQTAQLNGVVTTTSNHNHLTRLSVRADCGQHSPAATAAEERVERVGVTPRRGERSRTTSSSGGSSSGHTNAAAAAKTINADKQPILRLSPLCESAYGSNDAAAAASTKHHLRSKKQLRLPTSLQGTTAEDNANAVASAAAVTSHKQLANRSSSGGACAVSPRIKHRRKLRRKRLSVEEKLIEDNRSYYKVEVLNSKLRSTGYYVSQRELELNRARDTTTTATAATATASSIANATDSCHHSSGVGGGDRHGSGSGGVDKLDVKEPVVMRFKKVRKSELSLLSDEAENFMFGEPARHHHHHRGGVVGSWGALSPGANQDDADREDDGDADEEQDDDEDNENTTTTATTTTTTTGTSSGGVDDNSNCSSSGGVAVGVSARRRRRTHAEVFIHDNLDYYKFDLSGSRLRFPHPQAADELKIDIDDKKPDAGTASAPVLGSLLKVKEEIKDEVVEEAEDEIKDEDDVDDDDDDDDVDYGKDMTADKLSFAFESVPVHEPWYQTYKRQDDAEEHYTPAYTTYPVIRLPYESRGWGGSGAVGGRGRGGRYSGGSGAGRKRKLMWGASGGVAGSGGGGKALSFRRRKWLAKRLDDKPRKSPRCHASTLAILSTLKYRRRRISPQTTPNLDQSQSQSAAMVSPVSMATTTTPLAPTTPITPSPSCCLDDESRSSAILDVTSASLLPEPKPEEVKPNCETDFVSIAESIENYFCEFYMDNLEQDRYGALMKQLHKLLVDESSGEQSTSPSRGVTSSKRHHQSKAGSQRAAAASASKPESESDECDVCLDVDPAIVSEFDEWGSLPLVAGPEMDFMTLLEGYKQCNSMERALYGHINPRAIDSLRRNAAVSGLDNSCGSSECGNSSTGELLGFTEDGRMLSKRRKRKKRNMTGWPKDKPKKFLKGRLGGLGANSPAVGVGIGIGAGSQNDCFDANELVTTATQSGVASRLTAADDEHADDELLTVPKIKVTRLSVSRAASLDSPASSTHAHCPTRVLRGAKTSSPPSTVTSPKRRMSSPEKRVGGVGRSKKRGGKRCSMTSSSTHWTARRGR